MNGMLEVVEKLKENFDGEFVITPQVKKEVVDRPLTIKKYELEALQVMDLIDRGILKMSDKIVDSSKLEKETRNYMKISEGVLRVADSGEKIKLIHEGEASCLGFAKLCKGESLIVIDERTTRLLSESPKNLKFMEK
jgi:predicted nucleic acid-binding protein